MSEAENSPTIPEEPTDKMVAAGMNALAGFSPSEKWGPREDDLRYHVERVWEAMIDAWRANQHEQ